MSILKCPKCNEYTLRKICKKCGTNTITVKPPRYSPIDKYGKERREMKKYIKKAYEKEG